MSLKTLASKGWGSIETLDQFPNLRLSYSCPQEAHTPWVVIPSDGAPDLPGYTNIILEVYAHARRGETFGKNAAAYRGRERLIFSAEQWKDWAHSIMTENTDIRGLNLDTTELIGAQPDFAMWSEQTIKKLHGYEIKVEPVAPDVNITPKATITDVHHDDLPQLAIAISKRPGPSKLWIVWPSTQLHRLPECGNDTSKAIERMTDGAFFVQMSDELVSVPAHSPHAVFSLQDCVLYAHQFKLEDVYEPSSIHIDIVAGHGTTARAYEENIKALPRGLVSKFRMRYIHLFTSTWHLSEGGLDKADTALRSIAEQDGKKYIGLREQVLNAWIEDIERERVCAWCEIEGKHRTIEDVRYLEQAAQIKTQSAARRKDAGRISRRPAKRARKDSGTLQLHFQRHIKGTRLGDDCSDDDEYVE